MKEDDERALVTVCTIRTHAHLEAPPRARITTPPEPTFGENDENGIPEDKYRAN